MRRYFLLIIALMALTLFGTATQAGAVEAHWTDGSTYQGSINYEAPPAIQSAGDDCNTWMLDPPLTYVYLTVHFFEGGIEYDSHVYPYDGPPGGSFSADVNAHVMNHKGVGYATWNIGTGQSQNFTFNCLPVTTPSTVSSTTSSTSSTTTTSLQTSSTSNLSTSSTTAEPISTSSTNLSIGINSHLPTTGDGSETGLGSNGTDQLANTGSWTGPLLALAVILVCSGAAMILSKKQKNARRG